MDVKNLDYIDHFIEELKYAVRSKVEEQLTKDEKVYFRKESIKIRTDYELKEVLSYFAEKLYSDYKAHSSTG